jgi:hypothetical protein
MINIYDNIFYKFNNNYNYYFVLFYTFAHLKRRFNNEKNNTKMQKFD